MPWAKIYDGLTDHPKVDTLLDDDELHGLAAIGLWTLMLAHTAPSSSPTAPPATAPFAASPPSTARRSPRPSSAPACSTRLTTAGSIHDYLDHNPSRDKVLEERRAGAERQAKSRARRAVQPDVDTESQRDSQNQSQRDSHRDVKP